MKFSLCAQYWNKHGSFVNIEESVLFIHENMLENVFDTTMHELVPNVEYDYLRLLYFFLLFSSCSW